MRRVSTFLALAILAAGCEDEGIGGPDAAATPASTPGMTPDSRATPAPDAEVGTPAVDAAMPAPPADAAAILPRDGGTPMNPQPGSPDAKPMLAVDAPAPAPVDAPPPAPAPGTMVIGAAGGAIAINEGKVFIRPNTLTTNTTVVFRTVTSGYPALPGNRVSSSVFSLEPHDQIVSEPVFLTLYHFGGPARVALYRASPGGAFAVENATITVNTAEAALTRFGYFVVAPLPAGVDAAPPAPDLPLPPEPDAAAPDASPDAPLPADTLPPDAPPRDAGIDVSPDLAPDLPPPRLDTGPAKIPVLVRGESLGYEPRIVSAKVGDTVIWTWEAAGNHSVVSGGIGGPGNCATDDKFNSGLKAVGETFSFTFTAPGTYTYHCAAHCTLFEGGSISVK